MNFKKLALAIACAGGAMAATVPAQAANWLMLQGTEPASTAGRAKVWGFIQPDAQYTSGTALDAGPFAGEAAQFNYHPADLTSRATMNIRRARIGVRGTGFPLDSKVNYFLLAEFGHNGITVPGGNGSTKMSDASITLNHIPGARMRIGQFKYPGSEEGLQAVHVMDYINFTNFTDQVSFERFFNGDGSGTVVAPPKSVFKNSGDVNGVNGRNAFRDVGFQLFDTFKFGAWEASYAAMIGNGNGINRMDNNNQKDYYGYVSVEQVYGGKGPRRQGWKTFAWYQTGKRTLTTEGAGNYDMTRTGVGTTFRKGKFRAAAEYMMADGMIYGGTDNGARRGTTKDFDSDGDGTKDFTALSSFNLMTDEEADGYYLDLGYKVLPKIELDVRYDVLNRGTKVATNTRVFSTVTFGAQYFFNKKTRLVANYEMRSTDAPDNATAKDILGVIDDRMSVSLLAIY